MNKKRWIAVLIAAGLLVVSLVSSSLTQPQEEVQMGNINSWLYGDDEMSPVVLEEGSGMGRIAKLTVDGAIASGGSSGLFATESYNHEDFLKQIEAIEADESVSGILLEVNSPGGGVYESAEIANLLNEVRTERDLPMYVSMKNMAASGGYYISAQADKIFATEETVTGSIGVIMSGLNYSGLLEKIGVEDTTVKSGALKDMGSATRPETEQDHAVLQAYIDNAYNRFVKVVSEGRNKSEDEVKKVADGRIYDGVQAKEAGLVDEIGYPTDALAAMREDLDLQDAELVEYSTSSTGFGNTWFGAKLAELQGLQASETSQILSLLESLGTAESPRAMYLYGGE
ncbi:MULTISPECIES: signal peptide peptidase SppA [Enterococcus]|uniref:Signal peptidase n=1 Tax=Enterococcus mundtii TaxID=53346 RepID=A0ABQ0VBL3_ENTMU|nr:MULTISPECIES: signal peptide peptidase SppA [Enterococcus]GEN17447.1 signal peptidase [Ligilactobacillus acidipiscis]AUB52861.1 S49 family peptidase [Enterococcus mundtii]MDB7086375.1 signal peptide peptidase SppA [Enterococcus mundtii]MZZ58642.1 signal peptide peptidase SppA [Enterococcus mundtii]MZZ61435.1 signal peptide peptidase SppA [Enterococcus mundtii]